MDNFEVYHLLRTAQIVIVPEDLPKLKLEDIVVLEGVSADDANKFLTWVKELYGD